MWKAAVLMFLSNPLIGVGTGNYVPTMTAYVSAGKFPEVLLDYNQPHNIYFFALATNGLLGLAALLYLFYRILNWRCRYFGRVKETGKDCSRLLLSRQQYII